MMDEQTKIRLIFAFKIKYLRVKHGLSYQQLSDSTGLSTSYLHDIEKGKKYPKIGKISALADAFGLSYDELVATTAPGKIQPIVDLLNSDFFKVFPLDQFGVSLYKAFDLFSTTPDKISAFISTILKITRNYQLRNEHFYAVALRSYQEMHDNYFAELEQAAQAFRRANNFPSSGRITATLLVKILEDQFGITVNLDKLSTQKTLKGLRSYFSESKRTLYIEGQLSTSRQTFLLARELAFQHLQPPQRPFLTRMVDHSSFELLLQNFRASYFAAAVLMDENSFVESIQKLMDQTSWNADALLSLGEEYGVTPEMLFQRMTNLLPQHFNIRDLFFLRLSTDENLSHYRLTKELHLSQLHSPYGNVRNEHYCRRWISINIIKRFRASRAQAPIADAQISRYWGSDRAYLCLSAAYPERGGRRQSASVTIGMLLTSTLREKVRFMSDPSLKDKEVNTTCERCSMPNCGARAVPPIVLEEQDARNDILSAVKALDE